MLPRQAPRCCQNSATSLFRETGRCHHSSTKLPLPTYTAMVERRQCHSGRGYRMNALTVIVEGVLVVVWITFP